ncbi:MAG: excinuclease ABC subunit UvrC, partial [Proteobacteria bacterium]|nr:excinuclease ABC subunit UvrC [Pseudomonadota bacterium]
MSLLADKIQKLPTDSGVYLMKNRKGTIIYVGKAKNLKNRVATYFHGSLQHSSKTRALVSEIFDFDLMLTKTEIEALLLERTLIRHHMPHFNILLRDDKQYPYLRICLTDPWPRIEKVRRRNEDGAHYIGPFGSSSRLAMVLKQVYRIFPLIRCSPHEFKAATRPCNYYHMKMCLGPCTLPVDRRHYISVMQSAISLLEGNISELKASLENMMGEAAQKELYEEAALFRDQIQNLEQLAQQQVVILDKTVNADLIAAIEKDSWISFQVSSVRNRALLGGDSFLVPVSAESLQEALASFILQYYANRQVPALILVRSVEDISADLGEVLSLEQGISCKILQVTDQEQVDLLEMTEKNALHQLEQKSLIGTQNLIAAKTLQEYLHLPKTPERIECIDISNLQATAIVASNVCFIDGKAAKNFYRRYEIKTVSGSADDFASIREVMQRRLERALGDDDLPDLMIIDGGRPQVRAAMEVLKQYPQLDLALIGLAKSRADKGPRDDQRAMKFSKERIVLPDQEE